MLVSLCEGVSNAGVLHGLTFKGGGCGQAASVMTNTCPPTCLLILWEDPSHKGRQEPLGNKINTMIAHFLALVGGEVHTHDMPSLVQNKITFSFITLHKTFLDLTQKKSFSTECCS